jgi:hypothetical protein
MKNTLQYALSIFFLFCFCFSGIAQEADAKEEKNENEEKKEKKKTISDITKACKKIDGLFPIYQDTAKGNIFMAIRKDQLDQEFIHFFHAEDGGLNFGWVKGSYGWEKVFKVEKYFDKLEFKEQNTRYHFDENSALARASHANINEPIFHSSKIEIASEKEDTFLIKADGLFKSDDLAQLTFSFPPGQGPKNPFKIGSMSKDKTKIRSIKNFPKNTDIVVDYVFENKRPTNYGLPTTTDARFSNIQIQHTILEMPDNDYQPRYEDPRVGHFTTEVDDQLSKSETPYRDMIHRWHLVKKDPGAALSEPVEPITFWMENTTPVKYRPVIKDAVERWNIAFEKAGFKNAVVVKQQPDDADWEAGDVRYNVLRWTAAPYMGSAWGPSFVNPRTGQILAADIMLDYVFLRGSETDSDLYSLDGRSLVEMISDDVATPHTHRFNQHICMANHQASKKMIFGKTVTTALDFEEEEKERMVNETVIELLLHEVGHTLGLAHNYISSQMWDSKEVHNREKTEKMGLTSSVMDYNPLNLAVNKSEQGNYQSVVPGPYDKWAIEYAYSESASEPMAEKKRLNKILERAVEDELRFANDADAMFGSSSGIDPRINAWDMSSDAIQYSKDRITLCQNVMGKLMDRMVEDGESYEKMYTGYRMLLSQQFNALRSTTRYVGGIYIDRNMVGQKENTAPFTPVAKSRQKEAMATLNKYAFSPEAFSVSGNLYKHLQYQRRGWNFWGTTEDPKILQRIASYQRSLMSHIIHPTVLNRMNNSRHYGNTYSVAEMLSDLTEGVFTTDLKGNVNPARQNLQISYVKGLLSGLGNGRYDDISKSAMLYQVNEIQDMMKSNKGKSIDTKAHRSHINHLIEQALDND